MSPTKKGKKTFLGMVRTKAARPDGSPVRPIAEKTNTDARRIARKEILGRIGGILGESSSVDDHHNNASTEDSRAFLVDAVDASGSADDHLVAGLDESYRSDGVDANTTATTITKGGGRFAKVKEKARKIIVKRNSFFMGKKPKAVEQPPGMTMMMMTDEDYQSSDFMPTSSENHSSLLGDNKDNMDVAQFPLPRPSLEVEATTNVGGHPKTLPRPSLEVEETPNGNQKTGSRSVEEDHDHADDTTAEESKEHSEGTITERRRLRRQQNRVSPTAIEETVLAEHPTTGGGRGRLRRTSSKLRQSGQSTERSSNRDPIDPTTPTTRRRMRTVQSSSNSAPDEVLSLDASERRDIDKHHNESISSVPPDPRTPPHHRRVRRQNSLSKPSQAPNLGPSSDETGNNESTSSVQQEPKTPTRRRLRRQNSKSHPFETASPSTESALEPRDTRNNNESLSSMHHDPQTPTTRRRLRRTNSKLMDPSPSDAASTTERSRGDDSNMDNTHTNPDPQTPMRRRLKRQNSTSKKHHHPRDNEEERRRSRRSKSPSTQHAKSKSASPTRSRREHRSLSPKEDRPESEESQKKEKRSISPKEGQSDSKSRKDKRSQSPKKDHHRADGNQKLLRSPTRREKEHDTPRPRHRSGSPGRSHRSSPNDLDTAASPRKNKTPSKSRSNRDRSREKDRASTTCTKQSPKSGGNNNKDDKLLRRKLHNPHRSRSPTSSRHADERSLASGTTPSRRPREQHHRGHPKSPASEKASGTTMAGKGGPGDDLAYHVEKLEVFEWG